MTHDEYAESDVWPLPRYSGDSKVPATFHPGTQMTPVQAPECTETAERGSRALPDAQPAGEALVQQIADLQFERDAAVDEARRQRKECALWKEASNTERKRADAAEAQVALRDEVERVRDEGINWVNVWRARTREVAGERDAEKARADAAESALRQVRELAERWKQAGDLRGDVYGADLRDVLDSARVGAADTQPEGAGERRNQPEAIPGTDRVIYHNDAIGISVEHATPTAGPADTAPESGEGR